MKYATLTSSFQDPVHHVLCLQEKGGGEEGKQN